MTTIETKARAKAIFAKTYNYPAVPFRSIGRKCFAWALAQAKAEAARAAKIAATPVQAKAAKVAALNRELALLPYVDNYRQAEHRRAAITAELATLAA